MHRAGGPCKLRLNWPTRPAVRNRNAESRRRHDGRSPAARSLAVGMRRRRNGNLQCVAQECGAAALVEHVCCRPSVWQRLASTGKRRLLVAHASSGRCRWFGPGPNAVGAVFGLPSPSRDPAHDVVAALAHWVEDGVAPDQNIATRYQDNDPAKGVEAQRPWCAYPATASYSGQDDRSAAASYACVAPSK